MPRTTAASLSVRFPRQRFIESANVSSFLFSFIINSRKYSSATSSLGSAVLRLLSLAFAWPKLPICWQRPSRLRHSSLYNDWPSQDRLGVEFGFSYSLRKFGRNESEKAFVLVRAASEVLFVLCR